MVFPINLEGQYALFAEEKKGEAKVKIKKTKESEVKENYVFPEIHPYKNPVILPGTFTHSKKKSLSHSGGLIISIYGVGVMINFSKFICGDYGSSKLPLPNSGSERKTSVF